MIKKGTFLVVAIFLAISLFFGCASPKKANKQNFEKALVPYLAKQPGKYWDGVIFFPTAKLNSLEIKALLDVGIIASVGMKTNAFGEKYELFDLTEKGRPYFKPQWGIYIGKPQLLEVTNFTEPATSGPYVISVVSYTYKMGDVPDWINSPQGAAFKKIAAHTFEGIDDVGESKATCILTANGWIEESMGE